MLHTLSGAKEYAENANNEFCCVMQPLFEVPLVRIIIDELHLMLRITDVMLGNLIDDAMERDEKEDNLKTLSMEKGA